MSKQPPPMDTRHADLLSSATAKLAVIGAGAIGTMIAAMLGRAGHKPALIARGRRRAHIHSDGLRANLFADDRRTDVKVAPNLCSPDEAGKQDVVFLAVKADAVTAALDDAAPMIGEDTLVVPLVNGIPWWYFCGLGEAPEPIRAVDPNGRLLAALHARQICGAVVFAGASMEADGSVSIMGTPKLHIGSITGKADRRINGLAAILSNAGINIEISADIRADVWTKAALNLATNPLSVICEAPLSDQLTCPSLLQSVHQVLDETERVAAAYGHEFTVSREDMIAAGRARGNFETSMLQDFRAGRPLELSSIAWAVFELAEKARLDLPVARSIAALAQRRGSMAIAS